MLYALMIHFLVFNNFVSVIRADDGYAYSREFDARIVAILWQVAEITWKMRSFFLIKFDTLPDRRDSNVTSQLIYCCVSAALL